MIASSNSRTLTGVTGTRRDAVVAVSAPTRVPRTMEAAAEGVEDTRVRVHSVGEGLGGYVVVSCSVPAAV